MSQLSVYIDWDKEVQEEEEGGGGRRLTAYPAEDVIWIIHAAKTLKPTWIWFYMDRL